MPPKKQPEFIASFDIGARNLACCVLKKPTSASKLPEIIFWKLINILEEDPDSQAHCMVEMKSGKRKGEVCMKPSYHKHLFKGADVTMDVCKVHDPKKRDKPNVKKVKSYTTQEINSCLLKKMDEINKIFNFVNKVDTVLFELQPSFNPKMKQISHSLYAWFLMKINKCEKKYIKAKKKNPSTRKNPPKLNKLEFVAAKNKLKKVGEIYKGPTIVCNLKGKYPRTKYYSKVYTKWLIENEQKEFKDLLEYSKKQDDLCDSYLQGLWFYLYKK